MLQLNMPKQTQLLLKIRPINLQFLICCKQLQQRLKSEAVLLMGCGILKGISKYQLPSAINSVQNVSLDYTSLICQLTKKYQIYRSHAIQDKSQNNFKGLQTQIRNIYIGIIEKNISQVNQNKIYMKQCKIRICKLFLQIQINVFKYVQENTTFEESELVFQQMEKSLRKICQFLKTKYPRTSKSQPGDLAKMFKEFDATQKYQYDTLKNADISFDSQNIFEVTRQIKQFFNKIIDELDKSYPMFQKLISEVNEEAKIGRKIPQNTQKYMKLNTGTIQVKSTQISRVLIKWMQDIENVIIKPEQRMSFKSQYKLSKKQHQHEQNSQFNFIFEKCEEEQFETFINDGLIKQIQDKKQQFSQNSSRRTKYFRNFNINVFKTLKNSIFNQTQLSREQSEIVIYSYFNSNFIQWMVEEKLIETIIILVKISSNYKVLKKNLDLIKFKVNDLLRCQIIGNRKKIQMAYNKFIQLEKNQEIQIVKIKNRFNTMMNDATVFFKLKDSFLIGQCQLILSTQQMHQDKKTKNIEQLNHFLYELERSPFGVLGQIAVFLRAESQTVYQYCNKINLQPANFKNIQKCEKSHAKIIQQINTVQQRPFVCNKCLKYYPKFSNIKKIYSCFKCKLNICNICRISDNYSNQIKKQFYLRIQNQVFYIKKFQEKKQPLSNSLRQSKSKMLAQLNQSNYKPLLITQLSNSFQFYSNVFQQIPNSKNSATKSFPIKRSGTINLDLKQCESIIKKNKIVKIKQNKVKCQELINYFLEEEAALKRNWKIHFAVLNKIQNQLKIKLYRYDTLQNIIVNVCQPLQKYQKHEQIQLSFFDILIEFKQVYRAKIKDINRAQIAKNSAFIFEDQNRKALISNLYEDGEIYYFKYQNYKFIIDRLKSNSYKSDWLEIYLNQTPQLHNLRSNIQLSSLQIKNHDLEYLDKIQWIRNIKNLDISKNHLNDISIIIKNCIHLQKLDVGQNQLQIVDFCHANLKHLNAQQNKIKQVKNIHLLPNLLVFTASSNQLTSITIPEKDEIHISLKKLNISNNSKLIHPIINLNNMPSLSQLNLSRCSLGDKEVWQILNKLKKSSILQILDLSWNNLKQTPNIEFLTQLKQMDLESNPIINITNINNSMVYRNLSHINLTFDMKSIQDPSHTYYILGTIFNISHHLFPKVYKNDETQQICSPVHKNPYQIDSNEQKKPSKQQSIKLRTLKHIQKKKHIEQNKIHWCYFYLTDIFETEEEINKKYVQNKETNRYSLDLSHFEDFSIQEFIEYNWKGLQEIKLQGINFDNNVWNVFCQMNGSIYPYLKRIYIYWGKITKITSEQLNKFENIECFLFYKAGNKLNLNLKSIEVLKKYNKQNNKKGKYIVFDSESDIVWKKKLKDDEIYKLNTTSQAFMNKKTR